MAQSCRSRTIPRHPPNEGTELNQLADEILLLLVLGNCTPSSHMSIKPLRLNGSALWLRSHPPRRQSSELGSLTVSERSVRQL